MPLLNIAEICPVTRTPGPGQRFAIWVQGCCFCCPNCISPDWTPVKEVTQIQPKILADRVLSTPNTEGVTVSGGEPMLQAEALFQFFALLRQQRDISLICFTGFTLEQLQSQSDPHIHGVLNMLDVLIDGQYIAELNDNQGLRGSDNQVVHFLSPKHRSEARLFLEGLRNVEIHLGNDSALIVGIPSHNFHQSFKEAKI